ncbi:hypothetical protein [Xanthomonas arboricola]|uniref:hypothetical protein n=1 Tax=Xanthomonas arboricola TaxID=56448 RepID=UPI003EBF3E06
MSDSLLAELIHQLSLRVTALEGNEYRFWVPVLISVAAIVASLFTAYKTKLLSADNLRQVVLQGIKSNIDAAKAQVESTAMQLAPLKAKESPTKDQKDELAIKEQVFDSVIERLLNAYNDGCQKFYKDQVVAQDFIDLYHQDIADYIRDFQEKFSGPLTRFDAMLRYYNEKYKNPKA